MIRVQGLGKRFGTVVAINDVTFDAADRRVTALLGPNGAGKSTTLRILAGVLSADEGAATVNGHDVRIEPDLVRANIGVMPHNSGIYPRLTARENIRYYGRLQGLHGEALERRIESLLEQLDMVPFADRRTKGFSQGQRVKVALARALVHNPAHVILDEPTNGLDVMATRALREIILRLREAGCCVLFSSHIMQEVANLCDDVVIIAGGTVRYSGTVDQLREAAGTQDLETAFVQIAGLEEGEQ
ncbi:MAG: ATP-binding cassette domain-containing protein [Pseudomonadales bacterium]|nr:ATP-binding cassette domain-containing protein [Pseudomonadales bacterium]